jgi:hypothetical protein
MFWLAKTCKAELSSPSLFALSRPDSSWSSSEVEARAACGATPLGLYGMGEQTAWWRRQVKARTRLCDAAFRRARRTIRVLSG